MSEGELADSFYLDALDDIFLAFDDTGTIVEQNRTATDVTGYSPAETTSVTLGDFFDETDADRIVAAVEAATETGGTTVEADLVTADGATLPYEFTLRRLPDEASAPFIAIGRDIADRRETEQERGAILNRMSDGFIAVDTDWQITYTNDTGAEILGEAMGRDPEITTFEGRHVWEEIPDAQETTSYKKYHRAMATGEEISFETYSVAVGSWFTVRAFPSDTGLSVYFRDITEERRQRDQIETRERVLREMCEIIADRQRSFSEQVQAFLALGREELGTAYGSLSRIEGDEYVFEFVDADDDSLQVGEVVPLSATNCEIAASTEETLVFGDVPRDAPEETDRAGYAEWGISCYIGAPVFVADEVYGTFCFYDDDPRERQFSDWETTLVDLMSRWVSTELQRQQATEQLERQNEHLERFASVLSHDLRNPLTVALGRVDVVRQEHDSEHLDVIETSLSRIESLIDDVLTLARQGEPISDTEQVTLSELTARCWEVVATDEATLTVDSDLTFSADPNRLRQLLENLIRNATEHGGDDIAIHVGTLSNGDGFYVADDGVGIPEDDRESVFESGYSTDDDGTGFGLAIVEEIANAHGWRVTVTESETDGARFEITGVDVTE